MITLLWIMAFFAIILLLAYRRASLSVSSIALLLFLLMVSAFSSLGLAGQIILWLIFLIIAIPLNVIPLRRRLLTQPIFSLYQKVKPMVSSTEREALSIGTVGWEGELFSGMPDWNKFSAYSAPQLTAEEQAFLDTEVEELCRMIDNWDINHRRFNLPAEMWELLKQKGFFGLIIPKKYGGKEFSALAHSAVIVKVAGCSTAVATVIGVPNSLGPAELLLEYGTEDQKNHYLPGLAKGEEIPCFALTSPDAGSDASAMPDRGIVCNGSWEGQEILGIRLHWDKRYITLAPVASLLGLAFKLFDPDHLLGSNKDIGITCALIPTHLPGITIGRRHFPSQCAFPNGPTQGKEVFIPLEFIIGGREMAGKGWQMLMERLGVGRSITLPSLVTGGAKISAFTTGAYSRIRTQFHLALGKFEGVEEALARIAGHTYIMDATRLFCVLAVDRGERPSVPSAISKYHTTEMGRRVINDAMDIHAGKGICMGPRNYLAQTYQETPIGITVEGANILTRCMMIFGQGVMRCHPYLFKEFMAAQNPDQQAGLIEFDRALWGHIGFLISNKVRAFLLGLTGGRLAITPGTAVSKYYYQQLTRFSAAFAFIADMTVLNLGAEFKRREHLSGRLGDVLSMLYMGSAVLKQFENQGNPSEDSPLLHWAFQTLLYRLQDALEGILGNFPRRWLGITMRWVLFPLGRPCKPPNDALCNQAASLLVSATATRYRLTQGIYATPDANNVVGFIEQTLLKTIAAEALWTKIHLAEKEGQIQGANKLEKLEAASSLGIISPEEIQLLEEVDRMRKEIVAVDDFPPDFPASF